MKIPNLIEPNHRILIVDDNRAIHDDLCKILCGEMPEADLQNDEEFLFGTVPVPATDFQIDSAYQGEEGLEKVKHALAEGRPYALAFVDVRMPPGWDGVETIVRFRQVDPDLQTVICTAYSDYSWKDMQRRLGHSDSLLILKKPFDNIDRDHPVGPRAHPEMAGEPAGGSENGRSGRDGGAAYRGTAGGQRAASRSSESLRSEPRRRKHSG
ncbi:hypothetical protein SBA3_3030003 [Candidatus Sulfopaludibacter sp. SbA3]|nr:hypothetical protein SBA3_3030003 [Candidatus Sulfopaludibacter sp. SbA3]